ncbi:MAG: hemolysin family protein [Planctomycetaceae bacterium]
MLSDVVSILLAVVLVAVNGYFVAVEFALVKVRVGRVNEMVRIGRPFAKTAHWLVERLEGALSACQLGITMASLALGWVGEPAFAGLLEPVFRAMGVQSEAMLHTAAFLIAFTGITSLHLVIGEQAPKIFAIRRPEQMLLWCAVPLKWFYLATYPLMIALNRSTSILLRGVGLDTDSEHETPHTEEEIRALLREAHISGNVTRAEHRLINAVFEFDDMICRRIMVPRGDVDFFDVNHSVEECLALSRRTKHTRYPVCDGSLDDVLGVVHMKDLVGRDLDETFDWKSIMRPPRKVPENMPTSQLLRHFQATHQLLAFVIDEYGTVIGIVTLENVLEQIVGEVADEFDVEEPDIQPEGAGRWIVLGSTPVDEVERLVGIQSQGVDADTFSGLLMHHTMQLPKTGDRIALDGFTAEVLEVRDDRAFRVRVRRGVPEDDAGRRDDSPEEVGA